MAILTVDKLNVAGRRVFLRVDFNVPYDAGGKIRDDSRIQQALPTIRYLLEKKASLIIASHLGRPKGAKDPQKSLLAVGEHLSVLLGKDVVFPEDCTGGSVRKLAASLKEGELLLLENLRFHEGEEKNDPDFSKSLAQMAEVYVTDAFGALHRAHASTVGMVSHFKEKGIGFLVQKELESLQPLLDRPTKPFYAILGGAKVSDKIGVIENFMAKVDALFLGGALAYTFLKARGEEIGRSKCEEEKLFVAEKVLKKAREKGVPLHLPIDHKVVENIEEREFEVVSKIPMDKMGVDIGPETIRRYQEKLKQAKTVFWNGPMGIFEKTEFAQGTNAIARAIAVEGITSVVGGGESVSACKQAGVVGRITHLSTGGGASLEFLEGKKLPGLKVLEV